MGTPASTPINEATGLFQVYSIKQKEGSPVVALTPFRSDIYPRDSSVVLSLFDALKTDQIVKEFMHVDNIEIDHFYDEFCYQPRQKQHNQGTTGTTASGSSGGGGDGNKQDATAKGVEEEDEIVPMVVLQFSKTLRRFEPVGLMGVSKVLRAFNVSPSTPATTGESALPRPAPQTTYSVFIFLSKVARGMFLSESIIRAVTFMTVKTKVMIPADAMVVLEAKLNNPMVRQVTLELGCCIEEAGANLPGRIMYNYPEVYDKRRECFEKQIALAAKPDYANAIIQALQVSCTKDHPGVDIRAITAYSLAFFKQMSNILCRFLSEQQRAATSVCGIVSEVEPLVLSDIPLQVVPRSSLRAKYEGKKPKQLELNVGTIRPSRESRESGRLGALDNCEKDLWEAASDITAKELTKSGLLRYYDLKVADVRDGDAEDAAVQLEFTSPSNPDRAIHLLREEMLEEVATARQLRVERQIYSFAPQVWFDHLRCNYILMEAYTQQGTERGQEVRDALRNDDPSSTDVVRELEQVLHFEMLHSARRAEEFLQRYDDAKARGAEFVSAVLRNYYLAAEDCLASSLDVEPSTITPNTAATAEPTRQTSTYQAPKRVEDKFIIERSATFKDSSDSNMFKDRPTTMIDGSDGCGVESSSTVVGGRSSKGGGAAVLHNPRLLTRKELYPLEVFTLLYTMAVYLQGAEESDSLWAVGSEGTAKQLRKPLLTRNVRIEENGVSYDWDAPYDPKDPATSQDLLARYFEAGNIAVGASFGVFAYALVQFGLTNVDDMNSVDAGEVTLFINQITSNKLDPSNDCSSTRVCSKIVQKVEDWMKGKSPYDIVGSLQGMMRDRRTTLPFLLHYRSPLAKQHHSEDIAKLYPITPKHSQQVTLPSGLKNALRSGLNITLAFDEYLVRTNSGNIKMDGRVVPHDPGMGVYHTHTECQVDTQHPSDSAPNLGVLTPLIYQRIIISTTEPIEFQDWFGVRSSKAAMAFLFPTAAKDDVEIYEKDPNWELLSSWHLHKQAQWVIGCRRNRKQAEVIVKRFIKQQSQ